MSINTSTSPTSFTSSPPTSPNSISDEIRRPSSISSRPPLRDASNAWELDPTPPPEWLKRSNGDFYSTSVTFRHLWFTMESLRSLADLTHIRERIGRHINNPQVLYGLDVVEKYALYEEFGRDYDTLAAKFLDPFYMRNQTERSMACLDVLDHLDTYLQYETPNPQRHSAHRAASNTNNDDNNDNNNATINIDQ